MLNPDGVLYGNNRCSLAGVDLNRQWKRPAKDMHPTIFSAKTLIRKERQSNNEILMYVDLHGHSRKSNIFMYGCDDKKRPRPSVRVFPRVLSWNKVGSKYVSYNDCSFNVKKARETTARVVVSRDLSIRNSYTLEATFSGADFGPLKGYHFNQMHFQEAGASLGEAILDYLFPNATVRETMLFNPSIPDRPNKLDGIDNNFDETSIGVNNKSTTVKTVQDLSLTTKIDVSVLQYKNGEVMSTRLPNDTNSSNETTLSASTSSRKEADLQQNNEEAETKCDQSVQYCSDNEKIDDEKEDEMDAQAQTRTNPIKLPWFFDAG